MNSGAVAILGGSASVWNTAVIQVLRGGAGDDRLDGGAGTDFLDGGDGTDVGLNGETLVGIP